MPPIRRRFGQNFLTDRQALARIAGALQLEGHETVIEIGPGKGALTDLLVGSCKRLVCVEIDRDLVAGLETRYQAHPHVRIVSADVLDVQLGDLAGEAYVLCGNVPYYVTTPILFHALEVPRPLRSVFLVQKEVAERLIAAPGTPEYGALTVNMALAAQVDVVGVVGAGAFFPRPTVDSAIVRLHYRPDPSADEARIRQFVVGLFGQRRRQLARALRTVTGHGAAVIHEVLREAGLPPERRAETLAPDEFAGLFRRLPVVSA